MKSFPGTNASPPCNLSRYSQPPGTLSRSTATPLTSLTTCSQAGAFSSAIDCHLLTCLWIGSRGQFITRQGLNEFVEPAAARRQRFLVLFRHSAKPVALSPLID